MRTKLLIVAMLLLSFAHIEAQDIASIKDAGVYYVKNGEITQISPLNMNGLKMKGVFSKNVKMAFKGEASNNIVTDSIPAIYIKLQPYNVQTINNFVLTYLESKKGVRTVASFKATAFGTTSTTQYIDFNSEKVGELIYKIVPKQTLPKGCYGVYYNYGGNMPGQIYDFDIK